MSSKDRNKELASRLHVAAIHLLRQLRREGDEAGLSTAQLSAISTLMQRGAMTMTDLAAAERVRPPTMTRLVQRLERDGFVVRKNEEHDRRVWTIEATHRAWVELEKDRARRVETLSRSLAKLKATERRMLEKSIAVIERLTEESGRLPG